MTTSPSRPAWHSLVAIALSALIAAGLALWFADQANRRWCALLTTMDRAYVEQPPTTPTGQELAREVAKLRDSIRC